jgi:hypothetical protein
MSIKVEKWCKKINSESAAAASMVVEVITQEPMDTKLAAAASMVIEVTRKEKPMDSKTAANFKKLLKSLAKKNHRTLNMLLLPVKLLKSYFENRLVCFLMQGASCLPIHLWQSSRHWTL